MRRTLGGDIRRGGSGAGVGERERERGKEREGGDSIPIPTLLQLALLLDDLASAPATEILDGLRELERKTSLVFTLLKASVYSIVLQQEIGWGAGQGGTQEHQHEGEEEEEH